HCCDLSIHTVGDILGAGKPIFYAVRFCTNSSQTSVLLFCNKQQSEQPYETSVKHGQMNNSFLETRD
ncbi:hypothetical protein, partial [Niallia sp. MER 6]|uniref:hypothetical protein n=1 Tax=Niallia sp. MER 6 TaxID=2939567 RepID=UPI00203B851E